MRSLLPVAATLAVIVSLFTGSACSETAGARTEETVYSGRHPWGQYYLFDVTAGAAISDPGLFGAASALGFRLTMLNGWLGVESSAFEVVYPREGQYSLYAPFPVYVHVAPVVVWEGSDLKHLVDIYAGGSFYATPVTRDDPDHFGDYEYYRVGTRWETSAPQSLRASSCGIDAGVHWADDYAHPGELTRTEYVALRAVFGMEFCWAGGVFTAS